jgi:hypothetical protein
VRQGAKNQYKDIILTANPNTATAGASVSIVVSSAYASGTLTCECEWMGLSGGTTR